MCHSCVCVCVCPVSGFSLYPFLCVVPCDQKHSKVLSKGCLTLYFPTSGTLRQSKPVLQVTQFHASHYSESGGKDKYLGGVSPALGTLHMRFILMVPVCRRGCHYLHFHLDKLRSEEVYHSHKASEPSRNRIEKKRGNEAVWKGLCESGQSSGKHVGR